MPSIHSITQVEKDRCDNWMELYQENFQNDVRDNNKLLAFQKDNLAYLVFSKKSTQMEQKFTTTNATESAAYLVLETDKPIQTCETFPKHNTTTMAAVVQARSNGTLDLKNVLNGVIDNKRASVNDWNQLPSAPTKSSDYDSFVFHTLGMTLTNTMAMGHSNVVLVGDTEYQANFVLASVSDYDKVKYGVLVPDFFHSSTTAQKDVVNNPHNMLMFFCLFIDFLGIKPRVFSKEQFAIDEIKRVTARADLVKFVPLVSELQRALEARAISDKDFILDEAEESDVEDEDEELANIALIEKSHEAERQKIRDEFVEEECATEQDATDLKDVYDDLAEEDEQESDGNKQIYYHNIYLYT